MVPCVPASLHLCHHLAREIFVQPVSFILRRDEVDRIETLPFEITKLLYDFLRLACDTVLPDHLGRDEAGLFGIEIAVMAGVQFLVPGRGLAGLMEGGVLVPDRQDVVGRRATGVLDQLDEVRSLLEQMGDLRLDTDAVETADNWVLTVLLYW